jgi:hypothetical protein
MLDNYTLTSEELALLEKAKQQAPRTSSDTSATAADQLVLTDHLLDSESSKLATMLNKVELPPTPEAASLINLSAFLRFLSPAFLILLWFNFYQSAEAFFRAENRNWERYLNFTVNTFATIGWTILYGFSLGIIGTAFAHAAPYLLMAVLSVKALAGIVNCVKNIYYAYTTKDPQFLWEAAKELLSVISYTFGLVLTIVLGTQLDHINHDIDNGLNNLDNGGLDLLYASLATLDKTFTAFKPLINGLIFTTFMRTVSAP